MSTYDTEVDLEIANNSQTEAVRLVGRDKRVLDVGCWKGDLGRALMSRGCRVSGLDIDPEAAATARETHDEVVVADLECTRLADFFPAETFDAVVFADVLEHLTDPVTVLSDARTLLRPGGHVVLSIPNITHGSVRLALLQGLWDYTDTGHLDRTHLRFFSRRGVVELLRTSGYVIDELSATMLDVLPREVRYEMDAVPAGMVEWVRDQPDALVFQFMVRAHPGPDEAAAAPVPPLTPIRPPHRVRQVDTWTEQAEAELGKTHRLLTQRDHILGLEATAASSVKRAEIAERSERAVRRRLERKNDTLAQLRKKVTQLTRNVRDLEAAAEIPDAGLRSRVVGRLRRTARGSR